MAYTFAKRVGPNSTKYETLKNIKYYATNSALNPFDINYGQDGDKPTYGNCTWYAWGRFLEVMAKANKSLSWNFGRGNACSWYRIMVTNGSLSGGLKPKPGAIACWGYYGASEGNPGHVAFVESVKSDGTIEISQSGWSTAPLKNQTIAPGAGKKGTESYKLGYYNSYFNGFIYNPVDFGNPAGAVTDDDLKSKEWYIQKYGNGAAIYFEIKKYGYSHKACCAILGNMEQESGLRVYTGGSFDGNGSEGLCQWTFDRKKKMKDYAKKHSESHSWKSIDGQVAYLVYELENSEKKANKVLKDNSLSLKEMTEKFEETFERAASKYANLEARVTYANKWDSRMKGAESGTSDEELQPSSVDMKTRISKLYKSSNYERIYEEDTKSSEKDNELSDFAEKLKKFISNYEFAPMEPASIPEDIVGSGPEHLTKAKIVKTKSNFSLSEALIQAPFVEVTISDYTIGSYKGNLDDYPNYISRLDIKKINGEINQYTIGMVHQIRPGEDPNLLDKLFSKVRYTKISIRYGDCESGALFKDSEAIITNISQNRDYASSRITYTVYATSVCNYVTSIKFDFPSVTDKPSNVIRDLLYNTGTDISNLLLEAFPGMKNKLEVENKNLIPDNDSVLNIDSKTNIDAISYINYLVGCMSSVSNVTLDSLSHYAKDILTEAGNTIKDTINGTSNFIGNTAGNITEKIFGNYNNSSSNIRNESLKNFESERAAIAVETEILNVSDTIRNSLYFITYNDDKDGTYFKIDEVANSNSTLTNNIFEVTVGYPDGNDIYDFRISDNKAWSMLYDYSSTLNEYIYDIDSDGNKTIAYSPNIISSSNYLNEIQKNWWTQVTKYPISAQLKMRGILKPVSLMDYVKVNVVFYGQKHMTSGLYVITGEQDTLSGSGFFTNLSLLRVGD